MNNPDAWIVVDKKGKIYDKARTYYCLYRRLKELKQEYFRGDLVIKRNSFKREALLQ